MTGQLAGLAVLIAALLPAAAVAQTPAAAPDSGGAQLHLRLPPQARADTVPIYHYDKPPQLVSMPKPYTHGAGGEVKLQFVVDSTGKVAPATVKVVSSTNDSFNGPAIDALLLSLWHPAELQHHPVSASVVTTIKIKS